MDVEPNAGFLRRPDPQALRTLEWPAVLDALLARCASPASAARRERLAWPGTPEAIRRRLDEVREAAALREGRTGDGRPSMPAPDLAGLPDVEATIDRAARGAELEAPDLLAIAVLCRLGRDAAGRILLRADEFPALARLFARQGSDLDTPALGRLAADVEAVIDEDGTIRDDASPDLAETRRQLRAMRERISRRLDELVVALADHLQDRFVTEREGRPVVPVKVEAQSRVPGIVHASSGSGATVFVEPREVVSDVNALRLLEAAERRETSRLLRALSRGVEAAAGDLRLAFDGLVAVDHRLAAARLGADLRGVLPEMVDEGGHALEAARHPLLALGGIDVVPNDFDLGPGQALVLSGPNAGGKTVAMKTLGLCVLLAHAGLPVPARSARLRFTRGVFCELGDEQSLALSLSSFSAHVSHLARILRDLGPGDLVLVDELAGGTDPAEGAALAVAVVRHVVGKGAAAMVTTHYEPLKRLAERDPRVRSASMGLAPRTLRPTYVLRVGEIGMSAALHVAERYGLPPAVVAEARAEVPAAHRETQERLARIAELRAGAEEELRRAAEGRKAVDAERAALAEEVARARRREHEAIRTEVSGLWRQVHGLREELRTARRYLRATRRPSAETVRKVEAQVEAAAAEISPGGKVESVLRGEMPGEKVAPGQLGEGDTVYVVSIGREGILVEADRGQAVVAFGSVRTRADFSDLRRVKRAVPEEGGGRRGGGAAAGRAGRKGAQAGPTSPTPTPTPTPTVAKGPWTPRSPANTIDLRGMRVDEAIDLVDERLDRLFQAEAGAAYLVHGHGTGAVRRAVREHLRGHPLVAEWRPGAPGEGGDGTTAVRLK